MIGFGRIRSFSAAAVAVVVFAFAACGGSSGGSPGAAGSTGNAGSGSAGATGTSGSTGAAGMAAAGTPVGQCQKLIATICTRLKSCPGVLTDPTTFNEMECETSERVEFGCDRATSTAFPDCLNDVTTVSCASLFPSTGLALPASCDTPLNTIPLSTAQSKCADLAGADCMRLAQCLGITPTADQLQQCQAQDYANAGCGFATDVGPTYQQCLTDLGTAPCPADGGAPPDGGGVPSCDNAITFVP
jgi:hypothetical protein